MWLAQIKLRKQALWDLNQKRYAFVDYGPIPTEKTIEIATEWMYLHKVTRNSCFLANETSGKTEAELTNLAPSLEAEAGLCVGQWQQIAEQ